MIELLDKKVKVRQCPYCGQQKIIKSPWQELWRMPSMQEWLVLFMMAMMLLAAYAYKHDVGICRDYIKNIDTVCSGRSQIMANNYTSSTINVSSFNLTFITPPADPPHLKENISNSSNVTNG